MTEENLEELAFLESEEQRVILKELLDLKYGQDYILECRIKSMEKIKLKQELYRERYGDFSLFDVPDIIGFRISVDTEEDVGKVMSLILNSYRPTRIIDFFNNPKSTGYKAYNVFFENLIINTEIQVMTKKCVNGQIKRMMLII